MTKKPLFKTEFGLAQTVTDPETLFRDLRGRSTDIRHLWAHQADLLRSYHQGFTKSRDVAIELPTGAGKTLVGLLICEFRRLSMGERVAYLCPTRQLARQVGAQAARYGIKAHVLIGKQRDYSPSDFTEYQTGKAIAVTTYSGVFNSNPRISDSQTLLLDDAHAGENYISGVWTIEITRSEMPHVYEALIELFRNSLPSAFVSDMCDAGESKRRSDLVEMVPGWHVRSNATALIDLLDGQLPSESAARYSWSALRNHISGCGLFVSWESVLIRPFIPPARTHHAFNAANQRVYMSATLGAGGEIERVTGIRSIDRIPMPSGWEKRGSGRRLFLIPQVTMGEDEAMGVAVVAAQKVPRTLLLTPRWQDANPLTEAFQKVGLKVLSATDIEESIESFTGSTQTVLALNRYDGLDLPDDACRLLLMCGLPTGTNLQEKFLWSRISAYSLLRDRVLTRFTQGIGRCTRSDNDHAVVVIWGRPLVDFILKEENRRILIPELQAELQFGVENSHDKDAESFQALADAFLEQGAEWAAADEAIVALRERCARRADPASERLRSVVAREVDYQYEMWHGRYESALELARAVADALGGDDTKAYRAWWYYLASDAAMALHSENKDQGLLPVAKELLERASRCCSGVNWFARLARSVTAEKCSTASIDEITCTAVQNVRDHLAQVGMVGNRFEREVEQMTRDLVSTEHRLYHRGLKSLGQMLGFDSDIPGGDADPDCVWSLDDLIHVAHEAKSEQTPDDPIGVNDVRQAQSHKEWVKARRVCTNSTVIVTVIETPRTTVSQNAVIHSKSLRHCSPQILCRMAEQMSGILRRVRSQSAECSDERILEELAREMAVADLTPTGVVKILSATPVEKLKIVGAQPDRIGPVTHA